MANFSSVNIYSWLEKLPRTKEVLMKTREACSIWERYQWCIFMRMEHLNRLCNFLPPSKSCFSSHYRFRLVSLPNVPYVFVYQLKNWKFSYNRRLRYAIRGISFSSFRYVEKQNHVWRDFFILSSSAEISRATYTERLKKLLYHKCFRFFVKKQIEMSFIIFRSVA